MDYPNLQWLQWQKAVFQPLICYCIFLMVYLIFLMKKLMLVNETDHDKEVISDLYSDASDYKSYSVKLEEEQRTVLSMSYSTAHFIH